MRLVDIERHLIGDIWTSPSLEDSIVYLCDVCNGRFAGTDDERRAGSFLLSRFREFGAQNVQAEPFEMRGWRRGRAHLELLDDDIPRDLPCMALAGSPAGTVQAHLVDIGPGAPADFDRHGDTIQGKAVLASAQGPHRLEKYTRSHEAGVAAFLFAGSRPGMLIPAGSLGLGSARPTLPGVGLSQETGALLRRKLAQRSIQVRIQVEGGPETVTANNILAELPGSDPDEGWIVACAHYDGHDIAQGAQDNATGTAAILEAARALAPLQPHFKAGIRFALFSGEEMGMYGSEHHVRSHLADLDRVRIVFNADIVGLAPPLTLAVQDSPELTNWLRELSLKELGARLATPRLVPYSDHFSFTLVGVPSLMAMSSSPGPGRGWGHTAADTLDKLDTRALCEATVTTARILLRMAVGPSALPRRRRPPEAVKQALIDAGLKEPLRLQGRWPF